MMTVFIHQAPAILAGIVVGFPSGLLTGWLAAVSRERREAVR